MAYWIIKTEPSTYSFEQLCKDKKTSWDGVRNFQARNNLSSMSKGDVCFVYHSVGPKEIVGTAEVTRTAYPDLTATEGKWVAVEVKADEKLAHPVTLAQIKAHPQLVNMLLVRQGRLSVCPLTDEQAKIILQMSKQGPRHAK